MSDSRERILVHGPCLQDLTDFLYFDKIVYPASMAVIRPRTLAPGGGYLAQEPIPEDVRDRLAENELIIAAGTLIFTPLADELVSKFMVGADGFQQWMQEHSAEGSKILAKLFPTALELPAGSADVAAWLQDLDAKAKVLADYAVSLGKRVVAKFYAEDVDKTLRPGWNSVLSIKFSRMPCFGSGRSEIENLVAFLAHEETKQKRAALFNWHCGIDAAVRGGQIAIEEVLERIEALLEDYIGWLRLSGLFAGARSCELLLAFDDWFVDGLTGVAQSACSRSDLILGKRGLSMTNKDAYAPGQEIAYVAHMKRNWRDWFPMMM